jgi:NADP-dependent 3-hydroxy acid dehydrogenase YdfG
MEVRGKVVLITGASAGIGLATARRFGQAGAKLALVARSTDALEALARELAAQGIEAIACTADLRDCAQIQQAISDTVKHFGRIDILINNAGQSALGDVADVDLDYFRQIIDLNILGPVVAIQAAVPIMRKRGGGIIINVSSMVSKMRLHGIGAYAATKAALNMLSDTSRGELESDNIRVISIFPRVTRTDFHRNTLGGQPSDDWLDHLPPSVPVDSAEHVAQRILDAAINEPEEQYMDR